jgi:hypothetical protein
MAPQRQRMQRQSMRRSVVGGQRRRRFGRSFPAQRIISPA